jgi:hypothetical protein
MDSSTKVSYSLVFKSKSLKAKHPHIDELKNADYKQFQIVIMV